MRLRLIGCRNNSGVGIHYTNFCDQLQLLQNPNFEIEEISNESLETMLAAAANSRDDDINICWAGIDIKGYFRGLNIQWIVFESTRVPDILFNCLDNADIIWVPSVWGKTVLINNGYNANKIDVVPEGVDVQGFHPYYEPPTGPLQFLSIGKFEIRKSFYETLSAWKQAFGNDTGVKLILKTHVFADEQDNLNKVKQLIDELALPNAVVLWGAQKPSDITSLYRQSHVFVLPTKGEGWGLPLIEAAASGMPVITTNYSAHAEFLEPSSSVFVDYRLAPIDCDLFKSCYPGQPEWGEWAVPDVDSIARALITARQNYPNLKAKAVANSSKIRREFSWAQCIDRALVALQKRNFLN